MITGPRRFGPFEFDPDTGTLTRDGEPVGRLPNQPARVLTELTRRPGELVTREELRRLLWDGDTFVDFDACLNHCARKIRVALGEVAGTPTYVETVPRRGYRFIAAEHAASARPVRPPVLPHLALSGRLRLAGAALVIGLTTGVIAGHLAEASPWHQQMVQWLHQQIGTIPGVCYWPLRR